MNEAIIKQPTVVTRRDRLSPRSFLVRALVLGVLFLVVHIAGLRDYTTFLSGTSGSVETGMKSSAFYGTAYILLYLGFVVAAPIFVLTAGILAATWKISLPRA